MNGSLRLPSRSWPCLVETSCPIARPCPVFLPPLISPPWKPCAPAFKRICSPGTHLHPPAACSTGEVCPGSSLTWTGPDKPPESAALPQTEALPAPHRRFDQTCAPGYQGRKRGEVVRTRTVVLQAHTHQFLGTDGGIRQRGLPGRTATSCPGAHQLCDTAWVLYRFRACAVGWSVWRCRSPPRCPLGWSWGDRQKSCLPRGTDLEVVKPRLLRSPDQVSTHPESGLTRALYDCPAVPLTPTGPGVRLVVAAHTVTSSSLKVGVERDGMVYELFVSTLPSPAFTSSDVLDLYLHRGSFETALADEDGEQDSDRWCSRTPHGQEFWQIMNQWVWNLRLELGQKLSPSELHITEFAAAGTVEPAQACDSSTLLKPTPAVTYGPPQWARPSFTHGFPGSAFTPQPDGILRCPADRLLYPQERRTERDGSIRVLYAARIGHCRSCPLRTQCQESSSTVKPRRVSAVLWPPIPSLSYASPPLEDTSEALPLAPVLWKDWPRCRIRRAWLKIIRRETVQLMSGATSTPIATETPKVFTRAQRAHWRLSWEQRLARNARPSDDSPLIVTLHGLSAAFACCFGFDLLATA
jgi:hypothetical protein